MRKGRRRDSQAQAAMTNESDAGWSTDNTNGRSQALISSNTKTTVQSERMIQKTLQ
jgi:hypothetical protein